MRRIDRRLAWFVRLVQIATPSWNPKVLKIHLALECCREEGREVIWTLHPEEIDALEAAITATRETWARMDAKMAKKEGR